MPVRLTADEQHADFVVRKDRADYRIYSISDGALRWLKANSPHALWATMDGRETLTASRVGATRLLAQMRSNGFEVRGELCH